MKKLLVVCGGQSSEHIVPYTLHKELGPIQINLELYHLLHINHVTLGKQQLVSKKLLVVCGGQSSEHIVSRMSCTSVLKNIHKDLLPYHHIFFSHIKI